MVLVVVGIGALNPEFVDPNEESREDFRAEQWQVFRVESWARAGNEFFNLDSSSVSL